jgi:hypothetical protein
MSVAYDVNDWADVESAAHAPLGASSRLIGGDALATLEAALLDGERVIALNTDLMHPTGLRSTDWFALGAGSSSRYGCNNEHKEGRAVRCR